MGIEEPDVALYPKDHFGDVPGHSRIMRELFGRLDELAPTPLTVLVTGETGRGKEEIARSMHAASTRSDGPFVVLDCGCLPPTLVESALLGHVRGAVTGAVVDQAGAFEQANGGTIFIGEVGELPMEQQVKLLRVLDRREYKRVGDNRTRTADARVIASTHRDLRKCKGIIVHAAKVLGMSPNGLRNRMKKLKLFELEDEEQGAQFGWPEKRTNDTDSGRGRIEATWLRGAEVRSDCSGLTSREVTRCGLRERRTLQE
ncbi:sigma-54-dependent Fis family transcriptional regulator [Paraliomyxa miuraensis]|uniref:sigma-54-dependent Fis family transcriptional regulator n=1 Tax=Paraliomyxa miuraensis TaxID=376150 RepID=UPI00224D37EE|nr:sigma-54-dependent Fis family transcriptional regulator [Paraliomyxa miuraensis]MCX4240187.1 sigma-54-dependent Fis family transcriptional regulator [Paraliomyxa miuraensis]